MAKDNDQVRLATKLHGEIVSKYGDDKETFEKLEKLFDECEYAQIVHNYDIDGVRICSECGNLMDSGYCIQDGCAYYCCDECLTANMTMEEYLKGTYEEDENGDISQDGVNYWTEWDY